MVNKFLYNDPGKQSCSSHSALNNKGGKRCNQNTFTISFHRAGNGNVIGPAADGDGEFARTYDGTTLSDPMAQP